MSGAALCLAPLPIEAEPLSAMPAMACDTHAHVIEGGPAYPLADGRSYTPPPAPLAAYERMLAQVGFARGVLVQPSVYGTDNRYLLKCVAPRQDRLRAVAVIPDAIPEAEVECMHRAGVRGFRINLLFGGGGVGMEALERIASIVAPFGWHAQLLIDLRTLDDSLEARLRALPVETVFDHMGHFPAELGTDWPGFRAMKRLIECGRAWSKVTGPYRTAPPGPPYAAAERIARALLALAPERLVSGTDWPHVGLYADMPDTSDLVARVLDWCDSSVVRRKVFVENPARLYDFPTPQGGDKP